MASAQRQNRDSLPYEPPIRAQITSFDGSRYYGWYEVMLTKGGWVAKPGGMSSGVDPDGNITTPAADMNGLPLITADLPNPRVLLYREYFDPVNQWVYIAQLTGVDLGVDLGPTRCVTVADDCDGQRWNLDLPQRFFTSVECVQCAGSGSGSQGSGGVVSCCVTVEEFCLADPALGNVILGDPVSTLGGVTWGNPASGATLTCTGPVVTLSVGFGLSITYTSTYLSCTGPTNLSLVPACTYGAACCSGDLDPPLSVTINPGGAMSGALPSYTGPSRAIPNFTTLAYQVEITGSQVFPDGCYLFFCASFDPAANAWSTCPPGTTEITYGIYGYLFCADSGMSDVEFTFIGGCNITGVTVAYGGFENQIATAGPCSPLSSSILLGNGFNPVTLTITPGGLGATVTVYPGPCAGGSGSGSGGSGGVYAPTVTFSDAAICSAVGNANAVNVAVSNCSVVPSQNILSFQPLGVTGYCALITGPIYAQTMQVVFTSPPPVGSAVTMEVTNSATGLTSSPYVQIGFTEACPGGSCDPTAATLYCCVTFDSGCCYSTALTYQSSTGLWSVVCAQAAVVSPPCDCGDITFGPIAGGQYQLIIGKKGSTGHLSRGTSFTGTPSSCSSPFSWTGTGSGSAQVSDAAISGCCSNTWTMENGTIDTHTSGTFTPASPSHGTGSGSAIYSGGPLYGAVAYKDVGTTNNTKSITFTWKSADATASGMCFVGTRWNHAGQTGCLARIYDSTGISLQVDDLFGGSWALSSQNSTGLSLTDGNSYTLTISDSGTVITGTITDDSGLKTVNLSTTNGAANTQIAYGWLGATTLYVWLTTISATP